MGHKYFNEALKVKGNTGEALLQQLERRLDNVLYRLALAPTRSAARQMVSHGHVMVNNKRVTYPSFQVRTEDVVTLRPKGLAIPSVKKMLEEKNPTLPAWLVRQGAAGKIAAIPARGDITEDLNEQLIVEFYSR
jgi:small subunit ribosomal protein S4